MTRKQPVVDAAMLRAQAANAARQVKPLAVKTMPIAQQAARQAVPMARQAVPMAKNASTSVRHGTDTAVAWAVPRIEAVRVWAAPQLEHSAQAVTDSIAPMVSSALMSAAHKVEMPPRKRRRRGALLAGATLLAAGAAGGIAAVMIQRRRAAGSYPGAAGTEPVTAADRPAEPDSDVNGHPRIV